MPEDRRIFPSLTVGENLRLAAHPGPSADSERVYQQFPRRDERRQQTAGTMRGGEQQVLAIARALVGTEPELLLLDEPGEGPAPQFVENVVDIVGQLNENGVTILLVEQNGTMALSLANRTTSSTRAASSSSDGQWSSNRTARCWRGTSGVR